MDLRVVKTKEAIKRALFELIKENDFNSLTIKQLTEKANINRGTFYLHYESLESLKETYYDEFIMQLYCLFDDSIQQYKRERNHQSVMEFLNVNVLYYVQRNTELFQFLWLTGESERYRRKIRKFVLDILFCNEDALMSEKDLLIPKQYYIAYTVSSFMGVVGSWLAQGCKESPEEIADILSILNKGGIMTPVSSDKAIDRRSDRNPV